MMSGTLLVYPLLNFFRSDNFRRASGFDSLASEDFDGFQQVVNTGQYVSQWGSGFGNHTLSALLYFVPRSIWTSKEVPASWVVAENRGYSYVNLSLPVHAEWYLDVGLVGMVTLMLMLGVALGRLDHWWLDAPDSRVAAVVPIVAIAMLGVIRGPLGGEVPYFGTILGLVLLALARESPRVDMIRESADIPGRRAETWCTSPI